MTTLPGRIWEDGFASGALVAPVCADVPVALERREAASYGRVAVLRGLAPSRVLFVSDVATELDAALAAGMRTALCVRPGGSEAHAAAPHPVVRRFDALDAIGP